MEITKAAIRLGDKIYTGFDHGECFKKIPEERHGLTVEQGFVNSDNEFVDRKQAMKIARAANQLTYDDGDRKTLISEDLHLYWLNQQARQIHELESEIARMSRYYDENLAVTEQLFAQLNHKE